MGQMRFFDVPQRLERLSRLGDPKDVDARWTKKHGKSHYGYKNHLNVDARHKLVRNDRVTPANLHDSQVFDEVIDPDNEDPDVRADSAYRSEATEARLEGATYVSHLHEARLDNP